MKPKYKRLLLKLSGEALLPPGQSYGVRIESAESIVEEVAPLLKAGVQVAIVVGGGNIFRGASATVKEGGIGRAQADAMGMMATVINGLALQEAFEREGHDARLMTSVQMTGVAEPFYLRRALSHLDKGRVLILSGGTGRPYFTTDTAASLLGIEINADVLLKGTKVDGVYTSDPVKDPSATRYDKLTYMEVLTKRLSVMDATAVSMCMDHNLPIVVFDFFSKGALKKIAEGADLGTVVYG
jgi:uridylate kinase